MSQPLNTPAPGRICICQWHDWWADYYGQEGSECPYCKLKEFKELCTFYGAICDADELDMAIRADVKCVIALEIEGLESRLKAAVEALHDCNIPIPKGE